MSTMVSPGLPNNFGDSRCWVLEWLLHNGVLDDMTVLGIWESLKVSPDEKCPSVLGLRAAYKLLLKELHEPKLQVLKLFEGIRDLVERDNQAISPIPKNTTLLTASPELFRQVTIQSFIALRCVPSRALANLVGLVAGEDRTRSSCSSSRISRRKLSTTTLGCVFPCKQCPGGGGSAKVTVLAEKLCSNCNVTLNFLIMMHI